MKEFIKKQVQSSGSINTAGTVALYNQEASTLLKEAVWALTSATCLPFWDLHSLLQQTLRSQIYLPSICFYSMVTLLKKSTLYFSAIKSEAREKGDDGIDLCF